LSPGPRSGWEIVYDPSEDTGFRLVNNEQRCYLSSSFRNFPDWDGLLNDTVAKVLHLELESVCIEKPTVDSSRLFVVDGFQSQIHQTDLGDHLGTFKRKWELSLQIVRATWRLFYFRAKFRHWQDMTDAYIPPNNLKAQSIRLWHAGLLQLFCVLIALKLAGRRVTRLSTGSGADPTSRLSCGVAIFVVARHTLLFSGWVERDSYRLESLLLFLGSSNLAVSHWQSIWRRQTKARRKRTG
jgi:hypothetical protein